jgi:hypothetical protein
MAEKNINSGTEKIYPTASFETAETRFILPFRSQRRRS